MNINRTLGLLLMVAIVAVTAMATPALADADMTTTREISVTEAAPGDTFTVTVVMECTGNTGDLVNAICLEETVPDNWVVTAVDSNVHTFSTSQAPLYVWLDASATPLYAGETRTIVYNVTIPSEESSGVKSISGQATGGRDGILPPIIVGGPVLGDTNINVAPPQNSVIYVNPDNDIQEAINGAISGDTIYFNAGTYDLTSGDLTLPAGIDLTLTGAGADVVIVNIGENCILGADTGNLTFGNISIKGDPGATTFAGVLHISGAPSLVVRDCVFDDVAAELSGNEMIEISDNVFRTGIKEYSQDRRIAIYDSYIIQSPPVVSGNTFNGTYLYISCDNSEVTGNTFENNIAIVQEPLANYAIYLNAVSGITISNNVFSDNEMAVFMELSEFCTITENTFDSNDAGIKLYRFAGNGGDNNKIYLNNFVNNAVNYIGSDVTIPVQYVSDSAISYTYRGSSDSGVLGNYYDNYAGEDADGNGIGDTAYTAVSGNDAYPLMGAWDAATDTIEYIAPPTLSLAPADASVINGQETQIQIVASKLPEGLSGYNLTIDIADPAVAEIVDIDIPEWATLNDSSSMPGTSIFLKAVDSGKGVQAGAQDVVLATLTVSGNSVGSTDLVLGIERLDDDNGDHIDMVLSAGSLEVTMTPIPGETMSPRDLDGDGCYEDLTGNGDCSFADVVLFFHEMEWIEANMPMGYTDFNENGRIDFDDVVELFDMVGPVGQ